MTATMIDNAGENRAFSRGTRPSGAEWRAHDGHSSPHAFASLSGLKLSLFFWHKFGANAVESGKGKGRMHHTSKRPVAMFLLLSGMVRIRLCAVLTFCTARAESYRISAQWGARWGV